ncbi:MAG TPA: sigma-70 family RNA polymerase sigma factor [Bacteroidetes bacterium]|nr:sigma-70 family RNA polymerase sigma factor [Bacteroidota bacterium]
MKKQYLTAVIPSNMAKAATVLYQNTFTSPLVEAIKVNEEWALRTLYKDNYEKVETLILRNSGTKEEAKDIFQEAFIAAWRNIKDNKFLPENNSAINGYLYTIAKNKWMDYLRSPEYKKKVAFNSSIAEPVHLPADGKGDSEEFNKKLSVAMEAFEKLGEACKNLLIKFYFEKKSMKEIAEELQMDASSARNKKYRCMQVLRELAFEKDVE